MCPLCFGLYGGFFHVCAQFPFLDDKPVVQFPQFIKESQ